MRFGNRDHKIIYFISLIERTVAQGYARTCLFQTTVGLPVLSRNNGADADTTKQDFRFDIANTRWLRLLNGDSRSRRLKMTTIS